MHCMRNNDDGEYGVIGQNVALQPGLRWDLGAMGASAGRLRAGNRLT